MFFYFSVSEDTTRNWTINNQPANQPIEENVCTIHMYQGCRRPPHFFLFSRLFFAHIFSTFEVRKQEKIMGNIFVEKIFDVAAQFENLS